MAEISIIEPLDLMVVDDYESVAKAMSRIARLKHRLNTHIFLTGKGAVEYLESCIFRAKQAEQDPATYLLRGYLIDMQLPDRLTASEEIFNLQAAYPSDIRAFAFFTGHISDHDLGVGARTRASILKKAELEAEVYPFIARVASLLYQDPLEHEVPTLTERLSSMGVQPNVTYH